MTNDLVHSRTITNKFINCQVCHLLLCLKGYVVHVESTNISSNFVKRCFVSNNHSNLIWFMLKAIILGEREHYLTGY